MNAAGARTVGSLIVLALSLSGCSAGYLEIPIETPIQPKLDVRPFSRVYVAGFATAGDNDVDGNLETVRLLRSQLRNKGQLRVVDADAVTLADLVPTDTPDAAATGAARRRTSSSQPELSRRGRVRANCPKRCSPTRTTGRRSAPQSAGSR